MKHSGENGPEPNLKERCVDMKMSLNPKNTEICDIMMNFLSFNPFLRMTAFECLTQCKIFDSVRNRKKEAFLLRMQDLNKDEAARILSGQSNRSYARASRNKT